LSYALSLLNAAAIYGSLAALQVLLVNRLGLAFAALPAFLGLGAYAIAVADQGSSILAAVVIGAVVTGTAMVALANRLRRDYYLLATLALLECLSALFGTSAPLGGREGLAAPQGWPVGGGGFELRMLPRMLAALLGVAVLVRALLNAPVGAAIDRIREHPETASRWFRAARIRGLVVAFALIAAWLMGGLYLAYYGRISPTVFSLDAAILVLVFTVIGGRHPELGAAAALLYWSLPFVLTAILPITQIVAAEFVRIMWGLLVVTMICLSRPRWGARVR
jgi:ABC-type branched-subunit amino acid transport system permease subunit